MESTPGGGCLGSGQWAVGGTQGNQCTTPMQHRERTRKRTLWLRVLQRSYIGGFYFPCLGYFFNIYILQQSGCPLSFSTVITRITRAKKPTKEKAREEKDKSIKLLLVVMDCLLGGGFRTN